MKANQESEENLDSMLREWKTGAALPPRFQEQVWNRIALAEAQPKVPLWAGVWRLVEVALPRPRIAYAYLAALMVFGMAAGSLAAYRKTSHFESSLSVRYVQSVSPFQALDLP
jgi:hypothetical protein